MPNVYVGLSLDCLHHGHIKLVREAAKYGDLTLGLLSDQAIAKRKRIPILDWEARMQIAQGLVGVKTVVLQQDWCYSENILRLQPDYFVHGDDWQVEEPELRERALRALSTVGGELIEIPHTKGISSREIANKIRSQGTTPDTRRGELRRLLKHKKTSIFMEAHSALSALIVEHASVESEGVIRSFDGFWSSSLTDSTAQGKPDIELLGAGDRLNNVNSMFEVTTKPLIIDFDTGGKPEHFCLQVRSMERLGISAVIIEDKVGLKKNSLFGNDVFQQQEEPARFAEKIFEAKRSLVTDDFMIIARIESLILEKGLDDALMRAREYVSAGADGIMIHSRQKSPDEIFSFATKFKHDHPDTPLVVVPTSFNHVRIEEFEKRQVNLVIYANHLLRASYPAMLTVAEQILLNGRTAEIEEKLISIDEILTLIPGTK